MKILISTGFAELNNYWGTGWPFDAKQIGGSERIVVDLATALAYAHHYVTVRLPYALGPMEWKGTVGGDGEVQFRGARYIGSNHPSEKYHLQFAVDDYEPKDSADRRVLVACRSDPPRHRDYDRLIYLSKAHALMAGDPDAPHVGGGVFLERYTDEVERVPRRVIYTSSPDRGGHHAAVIGKDFDYVATYRGANEVTERELRHIQQGAMVQIHPCDPSRPSEFFCMSILEAMAAGTPCVISDADALPELWSEAAMVLPRPIDYGEWSAVVEEFIEDPEFWGQASQRGRKLAAQYDWHLVAQHYLEVACAN